MGEVKKEEKGISIVEDGVKKELLYKTEDPYWKAFFNAVKNGWK